ANIQNWTDSNGNILASIDYLGQMDPPSVMFDPETRDQVAGPLSRNISPEKRSGAMMFFNSDTKRIEFYIPAEGLFYDLFGNLIDANISDVTLDKSGSVGDGTVSGVQPNSFGLSVKAGLANIGIAINNGIATLKGVVADSVTTKTATIKYLQMVSTKGDIYCTWIDDNGDWQKIKGQCEDTSTTSVATNPSIIPEITPETPSTSSGQTTPTVAPENTPTVTPEVPSASSVQATSKTIPEILADQISQQQEAQKVSQQDQQQSEQTTQKVKQTENQKQKPAKEQSQSINIVSLASIPDINVGYGATFASINLPTTVIATLSDNSTQTVMITWDNGIPTYDPNTSGTFVFSGMLIFPENITNINNLNANINVTVGQPPLVVEEKVSTIDVIQNTTSGLLNGAWNFIKWVVAFGSAALSEPIKNLFNK
ncbi:MAG: Ig-like domain-containing protein, partial [Candidatus Staskawiczbacteria bacterium]|nr:Ig-like domain-containing protein [Candidatus Staskawiczbacteria bacterium]